MSYNVINRNDPELKGLIAKLVAEQRQPTEDWMEYVLNMAMLLRTVWRDDVALAKLCRNPVEVLKAEGVLKSDSVMRISIHVEDGTVFNLPIPKEKLMDDDALIKLADQCIRCCADGC